jgi:hypothetical protein
VGRVTQRVDPARVDDLLERPPRAAIAFVRDGAVEPVPVTYRRAEGQHWIGVARDALPAEGPPGGGVLLVDGGRYWFELRAITLRGRLAVTAAPPPGGDARLVWLEFVPDHAVAWDYGTLHEESGA